MPKTLKDIVKNSSDLYLIKVEKPSGQQRHNKSLWKFTMIDPRWTDDSFKNYKFKTVHLRRDNGFFLAYKSDESNAYFVDPKGAMYRTSVNKYVNNMVDYSVKTNDISITKNEPSFRITQREMHNRGLDNFLDLCYEYRNYTAIGTGYTRDIRNLIVLDIDVDCTKPDNRDEIVRILNIFAEHNALPDFYIFNKNSNHVQLQWLIRNLQYKEIDQEIIDNITKDLFTDDVKNKVVDFRNTDFTKLSDEGYKYRQYTYALCDISPKRKFGDRNYTFWKAKNPMSALIGEDNLELYMPYYSHGDVKFRSQEEMNIIFSTKESRQNYFWSAPTLAGWYNKLKDVLDPFIEKLTEKKVMKHADAEDVSDVKKDTKTKKSNKSYGESRNTFVVSCTRQTTWDIARMHGIHKPEDVKKLTHDEYNTLFKEVYGEVYDKFKEQDRAYGGIWPDTTNKSSFPISEFKKAFNSSFPYALQNIDNRQYTDEERQKSKKSRRRRKDLRLIVVDKIRHKNTKITRVELLKETNKDLLKIQVKPISLGSLKRYVKESKEMSDEERVQLQLQLNERKEYIESKNS